eukprot:3160074-Rhodomonas_salina.1
MVPPKMMMMPFTLEHVCRQDAWVLVLKKNAMKSCDPIRFKISCRIRRLQWTQHVPRFLSRRAMTISSTLPCRLMLVGTTRHSTTKRYNFTKKRTTCCPFSA